MCPQCGAEVPPGFAFCGRCGTRLAPPAPAALITEEELARIEPYLPPGTLDNLPPAALWQPADVTRVQEILTRLLDNVVTYLPRYLVQIELAAPETTAGGEFLRGTLLFSDISGFTAMSERLSTLGKDGAEQIVALVNRYFSAMLHVLFTYGGDLFKFGGDALLAFFPDSPETPGSVNALHAAWAMQQAMAAFREVETSLGTFPLQMKIGMHAGPFFAARVGTPKKREFVVTGATVNATAMAESAAVAGQILASDAVYAQAQTQPGCTFSPGPPGYYLLDTLTPFSLFPPRPFSLSPHLRQKSCARLRPRSNASRPICRRACWRVCCRSRAGVTLILRSMKAENIAWWRSSSPTLPARVISSSVWDRGVRPLLRAR